MANDYGELALDEFVEAVFKLIIDHHHRRVVELDLTLPQAQTLRILAREALSTSRLAAELRISAPAVTQLTDRLTRKALIDRRPVEGDRRKVLLALTAQGKSLVDGFRQHRNRAFASALGHLNQEDRAEVVEALRKISWALGTEASRAETPRAADPSRPPLHQPAASKERAGARTAPVPRRIRMEWD
jgi:DNA-binding MarR family transcriptional regulator